MFSSFDFPPDLFWTHCVCSQVKMDALHTIDIENEVLSCRPQLDHAVGEVSGEQQRKRKFKVTDLASEEKDDITAEMVKRFLSQINQRKDQRPSPKAKLLARRNTLTLTTMNRKKTMTSSRR